MTFLSALFRPWVLWGGIVVALLTIPLVASAKGGLSLTQTRVIFMQKEKSTAITLVNRSKGPFLVKADITREPGLRDAQPPAFMVTPPLFRVEPDSRHTVVIIRQGQASLPTDRESVFYANFLAIPASSPSEGEETSGVAAQISLGISTTIKLFYRPTGLAMAASVAPEKLTFKATPSGVIVYNPTPYYVTLSQVSVNGVMVPLEYETAMVAPFATQQWPSVGVSHGPIVWRAINDYGGETPAYHATLTSETQP
ncbi:gram-negative pili assembly chaperone domain protein [Providencia rettgeri DSM 1131]|uniref:fimbrial biogenesis chaperone n=1 Tax=Providencia rettgeri TaxID=587 RepID=UPI000197C015|nr:gram-negative pili assembly chaperone domain protein [Providencia rettgeri DSM 1131]QXA57391.1 molecular chaperone [Providencia rettgeri]